jgi:transposase
MPINARDWLVAGVTDMHRTFNTLVAQADKIMEFYPYSGNMFVFCGRGSDIFKIIWWDSQGPVCSPRGWRRVGLFGLQPKMARST